MAERTKAALEDLMAAVKAGDHAKAAALLVYRGRDRDRKYKDVFDWTNEEDKPFVETTVEGMAEKLQQGEIVFKSFRTEKEGEDQEWLIWNAVQKTEEGDKELLFACLEIDGNIALGDVD
jgi:hypothetical protein